MNKAIIFVDAKSDDNKDEPLSFLSVGGLSLLTRQLKQLNAVGIEHVYLLSFSMPEKLHKALPKFKNIVSKLEVADANFTDLEFWGAIDQAIMLEEGRVVDNRIIKAIANSCSGNSFAHFGNDEVLYGQDGEARISVGDENKLFASCALVTGSCLQVASQAEGFKERPVSTILNVMASEGEAKALNVNTIETYVADQLRDVPMFWRPVSKRAEAARATQMLIDHGHCGVLDFPAKYIHPLFANLLTHSLLKTPINAVLVSVFIVLFSFYLAYLFAVGQVGIAIAGAMVVGVLIDYRQNLTVVKEQPSKLGFFEHILDNIVEYAWYLSMAFYLSNSTESNGPWAVGLLIILFSWAGLVQARFYRCLTSKHLNDTGVFERVLGLIGSRRNTRIWALAFFALTQNFELGFWALAIYTAITFLTYQWRFIVRTNDYMSKVSGSFANDLNKTRFFD